MFLFDGLPDCFVLLNCGYKPYMLIKLYCNFTSTWCLLFIDVTATVGELAYQCIDYLIGVTFFKINCLRYCFLKTSREHHFGVIVCETFPILLLIAIVVLSMARYMHLQL